MDGNDAPGKICAVYQNRRDVLIKGLRQAGWTMKPPKASMFVWAPIPEPFRAMGSLEFAKQLMQETHWRYRRGSVSYLWVRTCALQLN